MTERKPSRTHLDPSKDSVWWDWWSENPIEVVLIVFILVLFFALPRQGCGITENPEPTNTPAAAASD